MRHISEYFDAFKKTLTVAFGNSDDSKSVIGSPSLMDKGYHIS